MSYRTSSSHPSDIYPAEILDWSEGLITEDVEPTEQQRRLDAILYDDDVMHAAKPALAHILADDDRWQGEDRLGRLDGFWQFIEQASRLFEQQPAGSHLRYNTDDEPLAFATPAELAQDVAHAMDLSLELSSLLERIAPTIQQAAGVPIDNAVRLIAQLDALHTACIETAHHYNTGPELPGGDVVQWITAQLDALASLHLRGNFPALVLAVCQALQSYDAENAALGVVFKGHPAYATTALRH